MKRLLDTFIRKQVKMDDWLISWSLKLKDGEFTLENASIVEYDAVGQKTWYVMKDPLDTFYGYFEDIVLESNTIEQILEKFQWYP